jgi:hypothetical protein
MSETLRALIAKWHELAERPIEKPSFYKAGISYGMSKCACELEAALDAPAAAREGAEEPEPECVCNYNPATGMRFSIVCPKHDGPAGAEPQRPQPPAEFNTNDYVWVRLQKRGLDAIAADPLEAACHAHRKSVDGWTRWQLWQLMSTLGHLCFMGPEPPFETTIRFAEPVAHAQTPERP